MFVTNFRTICYYFLYECWNKRPYYVNNVNVVNNVNGGNAYGYAEYVVN